MTNARREGLDGERFLLKRPGWRNSRRSSEELRMASSTELVAAICALIRTSPEPVPITFRNHTVDEARGGSGPLPCPANTLARSVC